VYEAFFRWLGYGEAIDPMVGAWRGGDRRRVLQLAPTELIEDIFVMGDARAQRARLAAYAERGIDVPVVMIIPAGGPTERLDADACGRLVEALAPEG
jgi:hypothetical protein